MVKHGDILQTVARSHLPCHSESAHLTWCRYETWSVVNLVCLFACGVDRIRSIVASSFRLHAPHALGSSMHAGCMVWKHGVHVFVYTSLWQGGR